MLSAGKLDLLFDLAILIKAGLKFSMLGSEAMWWLAAAIALVVALVITLKLTRRLARR